MTAYTNASLHVHITRISYHTSVQDTKTISPVLDTAMGKNTPKLMGHQHKLKFDHISSWADSTLRIQKCSSFFFKLYNTQSYPGFLQGFSIFKQLNSVKQKFIIWCLQTPTLMAKVDEAHSIQHNVGLKSSQG